MGICTKRPRLTPRAWQRGFRFPLCLFCWVGGRQYDRRADRPTVLALLPSRCARAPPKESAASTLITG
eukprot:2429978-Prymnesium_polylepis.2